jgi:hypothetical protein
MSVERGKVLDGCVFTTASRTRRLWFSVSANRGALVSSVNIAAVIMLAAVPLRLAYDALM